MSSLINRASTKKYIIDKIKALRPGFEKQITRISSEALDKYEARIRAIIEGDIMVHRAKGKTFNP